MSYQVLARKYRPQLFEDIVAQEHITRTLKNSVKNNRIGSGYLFSGPRGTGKTSTARILAKAMNCVQGPTPDPCGTCSTCIEITAGNSLDVLEIDAASNTGVDDIRTLRENVRYMPASGKKRIYIIDEIHRLSGAAFDALLKTLEEPPAHVMFIFATTDPAKVPETILSRTQRFNFRRVADADLIKHLSKVAELEKVKVSDSALRLLARKADGSVRDSLSLLDQIIAFAGEKIDQDNVVAGLGLIDSKLVFDYVAAIASGESRNVLGFCKNIFEAGADIPNFVAEMLEHFRILLILSSDGDSGSLLDLADDELEQYRRQADYFSEGDIIRMMKMGADLNLKLKSGLNERLLLEMTSVRMTQMETTVLLEDVIERLQAMSQAKGTTEFTDDLFRSAEKKKIEPEANKIHAAGNRERIKLVRKQPETALAAPTGSYSRTVNVPLLTEGWNQFLNELRRQSPMLASQMGMATLKEVHDNQVLFVFSPAEEVSKQLVEKRENIEIITRTLRDHFRAPLNIKFEIDATQTSPVPPVEKNGRSLEDVRKIVENSPRLTSLLQKIDGTIIGLKEKK